MSVDDMNPCKNCTRVFSPDAHGNYRKVQGRRERDPKNRAKTFPGVAKAMAEQWGGDIMVNQA